MRRAFVLWALLAGCGGPPGDPGTVAAHRARGVDVMYRQRLTFTQGEEERVLDVVLQLRGDVLTVVALNPFGARAFSIEQRGAEVTVQGASGRDLPVPPERVLLDVHRVMLPPADRAEPSRALADGAHRYDAGAEHVVERWRGGRLIERVITRGDRGRAVRVDYGAGMPPFEPPPRIEYENPWAGYHLRIETLETQRL